MKYRIVGTNAHGTVVDQEFDDYLPGVYWFLNQFPHLMPNNRNVGPSPGTEYFGPQSCGPTPPAEHIPKMRFNGDLTFADALGAALEEIGVIPRRTGVGGIQTAVDRFTLEGIGSGEVVVRSAERVVAFAWNHPISDADLAGLRLAQ